MTLRNGSQHQFVQRSPCEEDQNRALPSTNSRRDRSSALYVQQETRIGTPCPCDRRQGGSEQERSHGAIHRDQNMKGRMGSRSRDRNVARPGSQLVEPSLLERDWNVTMLEERRDRNIAGVRKKNARIETPHRSDRSRLVPVRIATRSSRPRVAGSKQSPNLGVPVNGSERQLNLEPGDADRNNAASRGVGRIETRRLQSHRRGSKPEHVVANLVVTAGSKPLGREIRLATGSKQRFVDGQWRQGSKHVAHMHDVDADQNVRKPMQYVQADRKGSERCAV